MGKTVGPEVALALILLRELLPRPVAVDLDLNVPRIVLPVHRDVRLAHRQMPSLVKRLVALELEVREHGDLLRRTVLMVAKLRGAQRQLVLSVRDHVAHAPVARVPRVDVDLHVYRLRSRGISLRGVAVPANPKTVDDIRVVAKNVVTVLRRGLHVPLVLAPGTVPLAARS